MAIPSTPFVFESSVQLAQSVNSLESALTQFGKLATSFETPGANALVSNRGKGFDEWLANELQCYSPLSGDEALLNSTFAELPQFELEPSTGSAGSSLFEHPLSASSPTPSFEGVVAQMPAEPLELTVAKLQRAAALLNVPWSPELEVALRAQTRNLHMVSPREPTPSPSNVARTGQMSKRSHSPETEQPEEILAKRAKNTDAARRSRLKKLVKLDGLQTKVTELTEINQRLNTRVAILETEKNGFLIKEAEQNARIAQLETKIVEAHLALKTRQL
ncbi:hypothetical protein BGZ99_009895 [Dissophora globulifera]|uniref:BZIP domain-containing protein n=1 Tax=Dissophora globulifera TaxID=979702 RepID=A0A9P6R4L2_9FUNG|nr:hypothetical protein BGZ99_009895 [Dissophora globulifera]